MIEKFVIITNQRSGSNLLVSMLDDHPQIKCFGESMRITPQWMKEQGYRGVLEILGKVDKVYKDDRYRFAYPYEFVRTVFDTAPALGTSRKRGMRAIGIHRSCAASHVVTAIALRCRTRSTSRMAGI